MTRSDDSKGRERRREDSRTRAKRVKDNADWSRRKGAATQTPGLAVKGYEFRDTAPSPEAEIESEKLEAEVVSYILRRGGFATKEEDTIPTLTRKRDSEDIAEIFIARIMGPDEKYGLDRRFFQKRGRAINAHSLEDGTIIEYGVESYKGFVSRTYYVVRGSVFHPIAQHNFRKTDQV